MSKNKASGKQNMAVIKKLIGYAGVYKPLLFLSVLLSVLSAVFALYIPVLIGEGIDCIIGRGNVDFDSLAVKIVTLIILAGIISLMV